MQHRRPAPPAGVQRRPLQHSVVVVQPRSPAGLHVAARRHVPASQVVPAQHSVLSAQGSPSAWQAHRPLSQSMYPQHSRLVAQVTPWRWQQRSVTGVGRQSKSPQHALALVHV